MDARPGQVLTTEGQPVGALAFIASGRCRIEVGGGAVATIGPGSVAGEMTYRTGGPATATAIEETPSRLWVVDTDKLRSLVANNDDIGLELERSFAGDLREKLRSTTRALSEHVADWEARIWRARGRGARTSS